MAAKLTINGREIIGDNITITSDRVIVDGVDQAPLDTVCPRCHGRGWFYFYPEGSMLRDLPIWIRCCPVRR